MFWVLRGGVNDRNKVLSFYEIRDYVFTTREEVNHWDIELFLKCRHWRTRKHPIASRADAATGTSEEETILSHGGNTILGDEDLPAVPKQLITQPNVFLAGGKQYEWRQSAVWLGKSSKGTEGQDGVGTALNAHWFEPYGKRPGLLDRLGQANLKQDGGRLDSSWKDNISPDTVIVIFL